MHLISTWVIQELTHQLMIKYIFHAQPFGMHAQCVNVVNVVPVCLQLQPGASSVLVTTTTEWGRVTRTAAELSTPEGVSSSSDSLNLEIMSPASKCRWADNAAYCHKLFIMLLLTSLDVKLQHSSLLPAQYIWFILKGRETPAFVCNSSARWRAWQSSASIARRG